MRMRGRGRDREYPASPRRSRGGRPGLDSPDCFGGSGSLLSLGRVLEGGHWRRTIEATGQDFENSNGQHTMVWKPAMAVVETPDVRLFRKWGLDKLTIILTALR